MTNNLAYYDPGNVCHPINIEILRLTPFKILVNASDIYIYHSSIVIVFLKKGGIFENG